MFYHGEIHVHRQDGTRFEEIVGGEYRFVLKVMAVDRISVLCVYELVNVLASDGRDMVEKGFL